MEYLVKPQMHEYNKAAWEFISSHCFDENKMEF